MPMRPLKTSTDTLCCIHWRSWPPLKAFDSSGQTGIELYRSGVLNAVEFQRWQIWERDCSLMEMSEEKCRACPHVRRVVIQPPSVPTLVSLDGKIRTPIIDQAFAASLGQFRSSLMAVNRREGDPLSKKDAAWVKKAQQEAKGSENG